MKNILKLTGAVLLWIAITITQTLNLRAEDAGTDKTITVVGTSGIFNQYRAFASGINVYDRPEVESDILVTHKKTGIYFDLWHGTGLNGRLNDTKSLDDEIDFNLGCRRPLGKGWAFDVGVSYFNEPSLSTFGKGDIWWTYVEVDKSFKVSRQEFTAFAKVNTYTPNKGSGFRGDKVFDLGVHTSVDVTRHVSIFLKSGFAYVTEGFGKQAGTTWKTCSSVSWKLSPRFTLILPQATFYVPLGWNGMRPDVVFGGGFSIPLL